MLCSPTPTGEEHKRLGRKLVASHPDLTTREHSLPCHCSFPMFVVLVKHTRCAGIVPMAAGGACSRVVNAGSGHRGRSVATAAWIVSKRRGAGVVGGPVNVIAPASRARNAAASKASGIVNVSGNAS